MSKSLALVEWPLTMVMSGMMKPKLMKIQAVHPRVTLYLGALRNHSPPARLERFFLSPVALEN